MLLISADTSEFFTVQWFHLQRITRHFVVSRLVCVGRTSLSLSLSVPIRLGPSASVNSLWQARGFDDIPIELKSKGHLQQLLLQQRIPQSCWPNYSKFLNEIQSKQIIEIWDGIIEVVHQELLGNINSRPVMCWPLLQMRFHKIVCWYYWSVSAIMTFCPQRNVRLKKQKYLEMFT